MNAETKISAGGVYRLYKLDSGRHGFIDKPEIVEIDDTVASRCVFQDTYYYIDGTNVAEFQDPVTGEYYGQPIDVEDTNASA
jgi:hypothetical protein